MRTDRPSNQNSCKGKEVSQNEKSTGRILIRWFVVVMQGIANVLGQQEILRLRENAEYDMMRL